MTNDPSKLRCGKGGGDDDEHQEQKLGGKQKASSTKSVMFFLEGGNFCEHVADTYKSCRNERVF